MSIYDISAESSFKVFNYILILWGNMLVNVTKFIIKIYKSVELFILDTHIYDKFNNDYLTHPILMVFLTLSIILLCNLINYAKHNVSFTIDFVQEKLVSRVPFKFTKEEFCVALNDTE